MSALIPWVSEDFSFDLIFGEQPHKASGALIPHREGKYWSPYTNIIFANNLVLMPVYNSHAPAMIRNAVNVYRKLLPNFHVDTIDLTSMRALEGALHCMSVNIPEFATLPQGLSK